MKTEDFRAFVNSVSRERIDLGIEKLRPFMEHRISCESPEQIALTISAIACLLAGQESDTAELVCAAAREMHAGFARWQANLKKGAS